MTIKPPPVPAPDPWDESARPPDPRPSWLARLLEREPGALVHWAPVALGGGIAGYFALPSEPPPGVLAASLGTVLLLSLGARRWAGDGLRIVLGALVIVAAGAFLAQAATVMRGAPVLSSPLGPVGVEGRVRSVEPLERGWRVVLDDLWIKGVPPDQTPARLRLRAQARVSESVAPVPGLRVATFARLTPPSRPVVPGGYDLARALWFKEIGAVGFTLGPLRARPAPETSGIERFALGLQALRARVTARLIAGGTSETGPLAAAMLTGDTRAIPQEVMQAYRDAGLAHILAISGLNMTLAGGLVFVVVRAGLALWPWVALRWPIKKVAALIALASCLFYLGLSGAEVPAQRSFLMFSLLMLAVLVDRTALSLRTLAVAALAVLAFAPLSVLGPSFQMSFGAVLGLIALFSALTPRLLAWRRAGGVWRVGVIYAVGVIASSAVGTLASTPFAAHHFHRVALYGLPANMIGVPVTSFWVMPWGVAAMLLMPFGLEKLAVTAMGWGLSVTVSVAKTVAAWPGAVMSVPSGPPWALGGMVLGALWLCLWQRPWRWAGVVPMAFGVALPFFLPPPDVLVGEGGHLVAVRGEGGYFISDRRREGFTRTVWAETYGGPQLPFPRAGRLGPLDCTPTLCLYQRGILTLQLPRTGEVRVVGPGLFIDAAALREKGSHALWIADDGHVRVETVAETRGRRPWTQ